MLILILFLVGASVLLWTLGHLRSLHSHWVRLVPGQDNTDGGTIFNEIDLTQSLDIALLCEVCDDENDLNGCFSGGNCTDGVCSCPSDGYGGVLCEYFDGDRPVSL